MRLSQGDYFLITPNVEILKTEFREFCVDNLVIRSINDIFTAAGIAQGKSEKNSSGTRRSLVEDYYASLNWESMESIRKFVKVLENTLLISWIGHEGKQRLRSLCEKHGFAVDKDGYRIYLTTLGVGNNVKNLIFAASGPKPEIIFSDSVSNDIEIVKNADYCLIYDRPIKSHGLLWKELVDWWREREQLNEESDIEVGRKLYVRLRESLDSNPEKLFWKIYFKKFYELFTEKLPALVPQVYLHYDPYTLKQLQDQRRLVRQRMDFLFLLSDRIRIVIEIDGKQHYAEEDTASPRLYSEMVAEDRRLKLCGYEVYRFGGYELNSESEAEIIVEHFLVNLFKRHDLIANAT
jgi:very-short-patch-repair endonuclease